MSKIILLTVLLVSKAESSDVVLYNAGRVTQQGNKLYVYSRRCGKIEVPPKAAKRAESRDGSVIQFFTDKKECKIIEETVKKFYD
jgi:lipopolysaccharide/colanic/teichoic acid biosynthesis glycosyltransferase